MLLLAGKVREKPLRSCDRCAHQIQHMIVGIAFEIHTLPSYLFLNPLAVCINVVYLQMSCFKYFHWPLRLLKLNFCLTHTAHKLMS